MKHVTARLNDDQSKIILDGTTFFDLEKLRSVGSGLWDGQQWTFPLTMEKCKALREEFGPRLLVDISLKIWAIKYNRKLKKVKKLSSAKDATLVTLRKEFPTVYEAMNSRPYQRSGVAFMAELKSAGNLDEVGLGKTLTSLAAIVESGSWRGTHLIICSKIAVESVWVDEIERWFSSDLDNIGIYFSTDDRKVRERELLRFRRSNKPTRFLIINKEMLRIKKDQWCSKCKRWLDEVDPATHFAEEHTTRSKIRKCEWPDIFKIKWDSILIDEAHKVLSTGLKSARQKSQTVEGLLSLKVKNDALKFLITGTPFRGKELNLWGLLNWIAPKQFGSKWKFAYSYFDISDNGFGKVIGSLRPERVGAFNELLDAYFLRRTRGEVRKEIPIKSRYYHWVSMNSEHKRQYNEFAEKGYVKLNSGTVESLGVLSEITRLRQFSFGCWDINPNDSKLKPTLSSPKLDLLLELLQERGITGCRETDFRLTGGHKYVIASQFTKVVDSVCKYLNKFGIRTLKLTGLTTGLDRSRIVNNFQNKENGIRVLVLNTKAGGESITLDKYCDEMFILDETWITDDQAQLEGRIDNRGQIIRPRSFHYIRTIDTIEESIADLNQTQSFIAEMLLDQRRGVKNALNLIGI